MRSFLVLLAAFFAAAAPFAAGYDVCDGDVIQVGLGDATPYGTVYYVIVGDTPDAGWGYLEDNGVAGLQRGGFSGYFPFSAADPCWPDHGAWPDFNFY